MSTNERHPVLDDWMKVILRLYVVPVLLGVFLGVGMATWVFMAVGGSVWSISLLAGLLTAVLTIVMEELMYDV